MSIEGTNCRDSGGAASCNNFVDFAELFDHKNRKNRGTLHSSVMCTYSEPDESLLTVSVAPFIVQIRHSHYLNLSLKNIEVPLRKPVEAVGIAMENQDEKEDKIMLMARRKSVLVTT